MGDKKICKKCGRELPISSFNKNKGMKDGLRSDCKECQYKYKKKWCEKNKERIVEYSKQYNKKYFSEHKEEISEYQKQWKARHKEEWTEYKKQYYKNNREAALEYAKQYYITLKGYCNRIRNSNISADKKYNRIGDELPPNYPTVEDYMELLQMSDFYDGKQYDFTEMGLDRIENDKPHTLDNVVPCTTEHNVERGTMSFEAFKAKFK